MKNHENLQNLYTQAMSSLDDVQHLKKLIADGVNVNEKDPYGHGNTLLHMSAKHGYQEIAQLLIQHKANIDAKNKFYNTPLHLAARKGHKDTVELLIKSGANVNEKNTFGNTPLRDAVRYEKTDIVRILLRNNADFHLIKSQFPPNITNNNEIKDMLLHHIPQVTIEENDYNRTPEKKTFHRNFKIIGSWVFAGSIISAISIAVIFSKIDHVKQNPSTSIPIAITGTMICMGLCALFGYLQTHKPSNSITEPSISNIKHIHKESNSHQRQQ